MTRSHAPFSSVAALRIFGDTLNPDEISRILGCAPTRGFVRGEVRNPKRPDVLYKTGAWILEAADRTPGDFDAQVTELFSKINSDPALWAALSREYHLDVSCGLFMEETNDEFGLQAETMKLLADRGIKFYVSIYAPIKDPAPSDPCPCDSGKTYGECCGMKSTG